MDIDLGQEVVYKAKFGDEVYDVKPATAEQVYEYQKKMSVDDQAESIPLLISFVCDMGLPEKIAKALPVNKLSELSKLLIGGEAEKK